MSLYSFSNTLKTVRRSEGLTQSETAKELLISRQMYCHIENGQRTPSAELLVRISTLFKVNPLDLLIPLIPFDVASKNPFISEYTQNGMSIFTVGDCFYRLEFRRAVCEDTHTVFQMATDHRPEIR